ncbi:putative dihydroneopterin triphosphate pyrophosphatase [Neisseria sp. oral taxon 020 str. F0370]|uniref:dihydroneopterin triphosphate diphosphatase n=1 Tax=unclassified Neisseria TaxID=2623750 RepID=UPI0002A3DB40|nr:MULTISPECIES: dihydroneopterin triphosphate diphosphatase [unclassified Neisseria]ASP18213.1 NUDIX pyrophosphatase [Neisseria sp. KEM232]EKY03963.1 putative dihydroneopterin triphosphate pyrophosphatase [Neisseria sp. oral taxon 020 str. F0370]
MPSENRPAKAPKIPVSVLVVLHDGCGNALLLERADRAGFWQSVTGSLEAGESPTDAALREVYEETGVALKRENLHDWQYSTEYEIYPHWRHRYPAGVTRNTEHLFSAQIPRNTPVRLSEHTALLWLPAEKAAEKATSPSNRDALLRFVQQKAV